MSEREALRFIERVNSDLALQCRLRALPEGDDLEAVVALARHQGFDFDVGDLRRAFLTDWRMRRRFYGALSDDRGRSE